MRYKYEKPDIHVTDESVERARKILEKERQQPKKDVQQFVRLLHTPYDI